MEKDFLNTIKKNFTIIFILIILVVVIAVVFGGEKSARVPKIISNQPLVSEEEDVVKGSFETRQLKMDDKYVKYDIKYPYFFSANMDFNAKIKDFIRVQAEAHGITSKEGWQARYNTQGEGDDISEFPKTEEDKYYFFSDYEVIQSNSSFISVVITYGGYSGGAHGYENRASFAYDIKQDKEIELSELFPGVDDYLKILSDKSKEHFRTLLEENVKQNFANEDPDIVQEYVNNYSAMIEEGTSPELKNFSVFSFNQKKIKIYFGQYQVGPYVDGMQEFEIDR